MKYAFIFGRVWKLSLAELLAYFRKEKIEWEFIDMSKKALILEAEINPLKVIEELGGTTKIIQIEKEFDFEDFEKQDFGEDIKSPISTYGSFKLLHRIRRVFKKIPKDGVLTPKQILMKKRKIQENALVIGLKTSYYGPTIAIADPFIFIKRDEKKPFKDSEMTLSRAMILVNLSEAKNRLIDYSANRGTVGIAADTIGVKNIYLQEENKQTIEKTKRNINNYKKQFKAINSIKVKREIKERTDAVATMLPQGPKLKDKVPKKDAERILSYLRKEYSLIFEDAYQHLNKEGLIAVTFPVFNSKKGKVFAEKYFRGFRMVYLFTDIPKEYRDYLKIDKKMIVDEEPEKRYLKLKEYCVYEVKK